MCLAWDAPFPLPFSPLPLNPSIALKASTLFSGIRRWDTEHKVFLYADDLLLYISEPVPNIPHILSVLSVSGSFSGYKLNVQKSECFPINNLAQNICQSNIPFHLSKPCFKYLGVNITRSVRSLQEQNFTALTTKMKADLQQRWSGLSLSLTGRVQSVKMNILPRYLYLFQCLPIFLPKVYFCKINSILSSFIWGGKTLRARISLLQRHRSQGGLGLPNLLCYY